MDRQNIKDLIRELLLERGEISSADVQVIAGITRQAAHYHLRTLARTGEIVAEGRGRGTRYTLPFRPARYPLAGLEEHRVWADRLEAEPWLLELPGNVVDILRFAFTEMVNNAIEHSRGTFVEVSSARTDTDVVFEVADDGVGAFRTVRETLGLPDDFAAVQEISKGKTTTDPERHTGQGIFFTSKAVDRFSIEANELRWTVDNVRHDQAVGDARRRIGTKVVFVVDPSTRRTLRQIFDAYTDPNTFEFSRSRATIQLFRSGDSFVSRSEAKRVTHGLDKFKEVVIDFSGVREVGQGFVDELFRVWGSEHPDVRLDPVNMSPAVEAMVRRGLPER
jgi:anti-sigma regulatory factor (Ser/Thr protein kinase)